MKRSAFAVRSRPARPDAEVAQAQLVQGLGVGMGDVTGAVVAHDRLHPHAPLGKPGDGSAQEGDRAAGGEIGEDLGVREPRVIVDHHVHVLPSGDPTQASALADAPLRGSAPRHPVTHATDATELLDVDVHELARVASLVAVGRLGWLEPGALAEAQPLEPAGDRREWHVEDLRDLGRRHAQASEDLDHPHALGLQPGRASPGARGAVTKLAVALAMAPQPLARRALGAAGRFGCSSDRPSLFEHPSAHQLAAARTGPMVSVELHPGPPSGLWASDTPSLQGDPDEQRA